jgi:hypothetical protein
MTWKSLPSQNAAGLSLLSLATPASTERPSAGTWPASSPLEPWRAYLEARFSDDPHIFATVLFSELTEIGSTRSYPTLVG